MNSFWTEPIVLSGEQFRELADSLRRPNKEYMNKRDAIFSKMDDEITIKRSGMDMEVEIADLDLSFIDEMNNNEKCITSSTIELRGEVSIVVNDTHSTLKVFKGNFSDSLVTVHNIMLDCSNIMNCIEMNQCGYNKAELDKTETYVKNKDNNNDMQSCKTEQITYAA